MDLQTQLEQLEGRRSAAYRDSEGFLTIGVGTLIDDRKSGGLRDEEIDFIRDNRLRLAAQACLETWDWFPGLGKPRQAVIILMVYQLGLTGVLEFVRTIGAIESERWADAAEQMRRSRWALQTPSRVRRLAIQMETGEWN